MTRAFLSSLGWILVGAAAIACLPACSGRHARKEYLRACECGTATTDVLGCTGSCRTGEAECKNARCTCESPPATAR
ncbi:MAG: hypothetical protein ACREIU_16135 [Planctomycetota bacterium]